MNTEFIETPIEALTFIAIELIMLTIVLALLTYTFLKLYSLLTKTSHHDSQEDFKWNLLFYFICILFIDIKSHANMKNV